MYLCVTLLPIAALCTLSAAGPLPVLASNSPEQNPTTTTTALPASYTIQASNADRDDTMLGEDLSDEPVHS